MFMANDFAPILLLQEYCAADLLVAAGYPVPARLHVRASRSTLTKNQE
jgi:hypothetical protein